MKQLFLILNSVFYPNFKLCSKSLKLMKNESESKSNNAMSKFFKFKHSQPI